MKRLQKYKKYKKYARIIIITSIFFIGFFIGEYIQQNNFKNFISTFKNIRNTEGFTFISPLFGSISAPATDIGIYTDIKSDINNYLKNEKSKGDLYNFSFYFRDLNSPLWFGIDEDISFSPASLFKLPIAIAIYREGEDNPYFLNKRIVYTEELSNVNKSNPNNEKSSLVVGREYSVEQLTQIMIELSDNGAKDLLLSVLDKNYINDLFNVVALINPDSTKNYEVSSIKYALFLRLLYNSSFINEKHSEYLLSLLAKSTFKDGIVAGVPKDVVVSHKFGTYEKDEVVNGVLVKTSFLHDCGIVYYSNTPYVICFMTKGKDTSVLLKIISNVSKIVYEDVQRDK